MNPTLTMHPADVKGAYEFFKAKNNYTTGTVELFHMLEENRHDINVIDVRDEKDFKEAHIPGAVNIPRDEWESARGLMKDRTNILYCYTQQCHLAAKAAMLFASKGFPVMEMEGGFKTWQDNKFKTEKG